MAKNVPEQEKLLVPLALVRPDPGQPRKHFDHERLKQLAASLKSVGQLIPATVKPVEGRRHFYELQDGERRWRACKLAGIKDIWIIIDEGPGSAEDRFERSAISNFCRDNLSHLEVVHIVHWFSTVRQYTVPQIAQRLGCTESWVYQLQAVATLPPEVHKLMHPSRPDRKQLNVSVAYEIAKRVPVTRPKLRRDIAEYCVKHRVRLALARKLIEQKTRGLGTEPQPRRQRGYRVYGSLLLFADRIDADSEIQTQLPDEELRRIFAGKDAVTRRMIATSLDRSAARLQELAARIKRIR